jgi:hypothetical protein
MTLTLICGSALLSADADLLAYNNYSIQERGKKNSTATRNVSETEYE